jgi:methylenetetrahydrofolate--tRNA-(uracil-5-)-methyltransferase
VAKKKAMTDRGRADLAAWIAGDATRVAAE